MSRSVVSIVALVAFSALVVLPSARVSSQSVEGAKSGLSYGVIISEIFPDTPAPGDELTIILKYNDDAKRVWAHASFKADITLDGEPIKIVHVSRRAEIVRGIVPTWFQMGSTPILEVLVSCTGDCSDGPEFLATDAIIISIGERANPFGTNESSSDMPWHLSMLAFFKSQWMIGSLLVVVFLVPGVIAFWILRKRRRQYILELDRLRYEHERLLRPKAVSTVSTDEAVAEEVSLTELDIPSVDPRLIEACASGECVLFAGAGVGIAAGYPSRSQMLSRMLDELESSPRDSDWAELRVSLSNGDVSVVEELLQSRLPREQLLDIALRAAKGPDGPFLPDVLRTLPELKFRGAIAGTWNDLLKSAFNKRQPKLLYARGPSSQDFAGVLRFRKFFILKPFGDSEFAEALIFTSTQYRQVVSEYRDYARFIGSVVASNSLFFVGASLRSIEEFLEDSEIRGKSERAHFALVPREPGISLQQERLRDKFNLELIVFKPTAGYPEVARFVENLRDSAAKEEINARKLSVQPEILDAVLLENIGPFESFELDFRSGWNIVLGDNGCGKSTIMRAIGLALCGHDRTEDAAFKLLRSGTNRGAIELRIGKDVYRTELLREGYRVKVSSGSITPVQGGRWLVLGFPALRGGSSRRLEGPKSQKIPNPAVDDLLPLVNDEIDLRFDSLKQWLINTAVLAERKGREADISKKMLKNFFEDMRELAPGVDFEYKGYTSDPWDIILETEDGEVSIGYLSQGMSSVFSWVGTLLQRMYAVYPQSDRPESEQCLVLVDEIGAHLHPEWQSEIVARIRKVFPNLQVIATTHSPLLVADADAGVVVYLERKNGKLRRERITHDFKGWRADQILTAAPFGMTFARGKETKEKLTEYRRLAVKDDLSKDDQQRLNQISEDLESDDLPSYHELEETRQAAGMMTEWMGEQLKDAPEETKNKVLREAEIYLAKIKAGG